MFLGFASADLHVAGATYLERKQLPNQIRI